MNEQVYRDRLSNDPVRQGLTLTDGLAKLGLDAVLLDPIRARLTAMQKPQASSAPKVPREWISESAGIMFIRKAWGLLPRVRTLREYLSSNGWSRRTGDHGGLHYDSEALKKLLVDYVPVTALPVAKDISDMPSLLRRYSTLRLGRLVLVKRVDVADLLRDEESDQAGNLAPSRNSKTDLQNSTKRAPKQDLQHQQLVA